MVDKKVEHSQVEAALAALQNLSKGDAFSKVETKSAVAGATQIFHTASNSEPGAWAGSSFKEASEDDSITENGTDYASSVRKSIQKALAKGEISPKEAAEILKGLPFGKEDKDDDKEDGKKDGKKDKKENPFAKKAMDKDDDEDDKKVEKSLEDSLASDESVQKGLEVSDFLTGFVATFAKSLNGLKADLVAHIDSRLAQVNNSQEGFNKSLSNAVVKLGEAVIVQGARVEQVENLPARAPKSQSVGYIAKSFGGQDQEAAKLPKTVILDTLVDMNSKNLVKSMDIYKFEDSNEISDELYARVVSHRAGK